MISKTNPNYISAETSSCLLFTTYTQAKQKRDYENKTNRRDFVIEGEKRFKVVGLIKTHLTHLPIVTTYYTYPSSWHCNWPRRPGQRILPSKGFLSPATKRKQHESHHVLLMWTQAKKHKLLTDQQICHQRLCQESPARWKTHKTV